MSGYKRSLRTALVALFVIFGVMLAYAAISGQSLRAKRYTGGAFRQSAGSMMALDRNDNVYIAGTAGRSRSEADYAIVKYDSTGNRKSGRFYDGPAKQADHVSAVATDRDGNMYVTGSSGGPLTFYPERDGINIAEPDYATIKYDSAGNQKWVKRYNGPGNGRDIPIAIAVDGDGSVYVTGTSEDRGSSLNSDLATIKYDGSGNQKWIRRYSGPNIGQDTAGAMALDGNGNIYVTGTQDSTNTGDWANGDFVTIKYNSAGDRKWFKRYNGPGKGEDSAQAVAVDGGGNIYVTGYSQGSYNGGYDYATIKYDSSGNQKWVKRYAGGMAGALAVGGDGSIYVTGSADTAYATIKYDSAGNQKWVKRYNGPTDGAAMARAIAVDAAGNVYVTGRRSPEKGADDYLVDDEYGTYCDYATVAYDRSGNQKWVKRYNGPGRSIDEARAITIGGDGSIYVAGSSATIKYDNAGNEKWVKRKYAPQK